MADTKSKVTPPAKTETTDEAPVNDPSLTSESNPTIRMAKRKKDTEKKHSADDEQADSKMMHQVIMAIVLTALLGLNLFLYQWFATNNFDEQSLMSFSQTLVMKFLLLVLIQTGILAWVSITGLLIRHPALSVIPVIIAPLALINLGNLNWVAQIPVVVFMLGSLLAMFEIKHNRDLYVKFNVSRLVAPHYGAILFGLALVIAIPIYLKLSMTPQLIVDQINTQVTPVVMNLVTAKMQAGEEGASADAIFALLPSELQSLIDPSLIDETLESSLNEAIDQAGIQTQIEEQVLRMVQPFFTVIPVFFGVFAFLAFFQVSKWFAFFYSAIIYVVMQMLLGMGVAEIQTEERPVETVVLR